MREAFMTGQRRKVGDGGIADVEVGQLRDSSNRRQIGKIFSDDLQIIQLRQSGKRGKIGVCINADLKIRESLNPSQLSAG